MIVRQLQSGFYAVPYDAVTLNGMPLAQLNTRNADELYDGPWALISPGLNSAIDNEHMRPYYYRTMRDVTRDVIVLLERGEWSCCAGVERKAKISPLRKRVMTLKELRKRTRKALKEIREHLTTPYLQHERSDSELIEDVIEQLLTDIAQDIQMERLHKQKGGE